MLNDEAYVVYNYELKELKEKHSDDLIKLEHIMLIEKVFMYIIIIIKYF